MAERHDGYETYAERRVDALRRLRAEGFAVVNRDEVEGLRDEVAMLREIIKSPAQLLNHLLDTRGVEASKYLVWGEEELPACILIPADLSRRVFGGEASHMTAQEADRG